VQRNINDHSADISMGAVDKVALGTAGVLNIRQDLGLVGQQFSCE